MSKRKNELIMEFLIDTGCDSNLISIATLKHLFSWAKMEQLIKHNIKGYLYQNHQTQI